MTLYKDTKKEKTQTVDKNCGIKKKLDSETKLSTRMINQTNEGFVETEPRGII